MGGGGPDAAWGLWTVGRGPWSGRCGLWAVGCGIYFLFHIFIGMAYGHTGSTGMRAVPSNIAILELHALPTSQRVGTRVRTRVRTRVGNNNYYIIMAILL